MKNKKIQIFLIVIASIGLTTLFAFKFIPGNYFGKYFSIGSCLLKPQFKDYQIQPTDWYFDQAAPIDWTSNEEAGEFRTMIRNAVLRGVNFAGRYVVAEWGCGSSCQNHAIVDTKTGKIVAYNIMSSYGIDYRKNSDLLVVNPRENISDDTSSDMLADTEYYVLKNGTLEKMCGSR